MSKEDRRLLADGHALVEEYDRVVKEWDIMAEEISDYRGLSFYCTNAEYRENVMYILDTIHHLDSLLYKALEKKARISSNRELRTTIKEIDRLENKYKPQNFIRKLNDDCRERRYLEKNYKKLRNDLGMESYDGRALIVENDAATYVYHIKRLTDLVDKHIHHILDE
ncbi:MAG: hypothetical protein OXB93_05660 [Cytophagales bacterium]|nr:hypothetical protein [Cytophagales bacterium]